MNDFVEHKCNELFDFHAILRSEPLLSEVPRLQEWLSSGCHASMGYMLRDRHDLRSILPSVRSVIIVGVAQPQTKSEAGISRCFSARDYHLEVKERLFQLLEAVRSAYPTVTGRAVVDTAPALEKAWAARAGLGWIGRNSLLVTPKGSFFNLGLLLLDIELQEAKGNYTSNRCGTCRRCIEQCPTGAIRENRTIDARLCVSYQTMEARRLGVATQMEGEIEGWTKGCDSCQECCPWNNMQ